VLKPNEDGIGANVYPRLKPREGTADDRSLLAVVLDTAPAAWAYAVEGTTLAPGDALQATLNQLVVFLNAYLALRDDNLLAVFANHTHTWSGIERAQFKGRHGRRLIAVEGPRLPCWRLVQPAFVQQPCVARPRRGDVSNVGRRR